MKKILVIAMFSSVNAAWASDYCKQDAQRVMEVREDYKNFSEVEADITVGIARAGGLTGERYAVEIGRLRMLRLDAQQAFFHSSGLKGTKLYKKAYDTCIAAENAEVARATKQAAREAARAARAEKAAE